MPRHRIMVRGVNWLGDAVMTTPALMRLRQALPDAHIALCTPQKLADLWKHHPAVDECIAIGDGESLWRFSRRLMAMRFDTALIFPNSFRAALEAWLAGIPRRMGVAADGRGWLLTQGVPRRMPECIMHKPGLNEIRARLANPAKKPKPPHDSAHQTHHYLRLVSALGASEEPLPPILSVARTELAEAQRKFNLPQNSATLIMGINPGAEYGPAKRWPIENFARVAADMNGSHGVHWIILGGRSDMLLAGALEAQIKALRPNTTSAAVLNLAGQTTLRELCAVLQCCRALLTNDTGPMHVAAALNIPVVVPFGSTAPWLTGPGLPGDAQHQLLLADTACAPCFLRECPVDFRCMKSIQPKRVTQALLHVLHLTQTH